MGWFSRNIKTLRAITAVLTFIAPGAGVAMGAIVEGMNLMGWKFNDVELSPGDAEILDPWVIKYHAFYERLLKMVGNAQSAADLNAIKSYCCTLVNQYYYDDMGLSREGLQARDNYIFKTFEALNLGVNLRSEQLNVPTSKYWAEINTASFNDPIYQGALMSEIIECEHYGIAGSNPIAPIQPVQPSAPTGTVKPSFGHSTTTPIKPVVQPPTNSFDQVYQESVENCNNNPCATAPGKTPVQIKPTITTPVFPSPTENIEAVDAEIMEETENESFVSKYKWPLAILVAAIAAKQIFK